MSILSIQGIRAGYGKRDVLSEFSLPAIKAGEVTALVGPNGAGKTTLLRTLAGLLPAQGEVRFDNRNILKISAAERARLVSFMPQFTPQRLSLTVLESVITALRAPLDACYAADAEARALAVLDRLQILDLALVQIDTLSGGQRQLASLAQALARRSRLLLLDEPTSALDLYYQSQVIRNIRAASRDGAIVVAVWHDLQAAVSCADSLIVMKNGRLYMHGPPREVVTEAMLKEVYGVLATVEKTASNGVHIHLNS